MFETVRCTLSKHNDCTLMNGIQAFHEPLREANPPIIHPARLTEFTNQVFANLDELRAYSGRFINILLARQREQTPVVQSIGDIILDAALEWGQAYMDYAEATVNGEYLVNEEKNRNSAFSTFLTVRLFFSLFLIRANQCTFSVTERSLRHQARFPALSFTCAYSPAALPTTTSRLCEEDIRRSPG